MSKKPSAEIAAPQEQAEEALDYRRQGYSYAQIAGAMQIPVDRAVSLVADAVRAVKIEPSDRLLTLDIERVELMLASVFPGAAEGDINAINTVLRLMDKREQLQKRTEQPIQTGPVLRLDPWNHNGS